MNRPLTLIAFAATLGAGIGIGRATSPASAQHERAVVMSPAAGDAGHGAPGADDPTITDGDHYRVVMENERTRVLEYRDHPGDKTHVHRHPDSVLIVLSPFSRRIAFGDGTSRSRSFAAGDVVWVPAQTHYGENIGTTDSSAMLVEFKR